MLLECPASTRWRPLGGSSGSTRRSHHLGSGCARPSSTASVDTSAAPRPVAGASLPRTGPHCARPAKLGANASGPPYTPPSVRLAQQSLPPPPDPAPRPPYELSSAGGHRVSSCGLRRVRAPAEYVAIGPSDGWNVADDVLAVEFNAISAPGVTSPKACPFRFPGREPDARPAQTLPEGLSDGSERGLHVTARARFVRSTGRIFRVLI